MKLVKNIIKNFLGLSEKHDPKLEKNLAYFGSKPHGYWIPSDFLNSVSVCYCVGAGDDISFDTELKVMYNSRIYIFDPTPDAKAHFIMLKDISSKKQLMPSVNLDRTYRYNISYRQLEEINYVERGVWSHKTILKFYDPGVDYYVAHSVYLFKDSKSVMELPVDSIQNFMAEFGHSAIDLLKIEIEGAEYTVIDSFIKDKVDIKILLVEFDEIFHSKGLAHLFRIRNSCRQLRNAGYILVHSTSTLKRTFIRKDIYKQLVENKKSLKVDRSI